MSAILTNSHVEGVGYTVWFKASGDNAFISVGTVESNEDYSIREIKRLQEMTASQFGDTPVDGIYSGKSAVLELVLNEINNPAALGLTYPESEQGGETPAGGIPGELGLVGALASSIGGAVRLQPYFTTLPSYAPITAYNILSCDSCWIEDGHEIRRMLSAGRHTIPLRLRIFPFMDELESPPIPKFWRYVSTIQAA